MQKKKTLVGPQTTAAKNVLHRSTYLYEEMQHQEFEAPAALRNIIKCFRHTHMELQEQKSGVEVCYTALPR